MINTSHSVTRKCWRIFNGPLWAKWKRWLVRLQMWNLEKEYTHRYRIADKLDRKVWRAYRAASAARTRLAAFRREHRL